MARLTAILSLALMVSVLGGGGFKCHSEQFYIAKGKLERMKLEPTQKKAIDVFAREFESKWRTTHRKHGCSHHEAHVDEFLAAASGVLSDDQFRTFRGRSRNGVESTGYQIRSTGEYISNLKKLAQAL